MAAMMAQFMPEDMRALGLTMHESASEFAREAAKTQSGGDLKPALASLARVTQSCAACHALMDPIGLGLENFDAIGGYRATEGGRPVDASGTLGGKAFSGVRELSALLSQDPRLPTCFAQQLLTYAVGRSFSNATGNVYAASLVQTMSAAGHQGVRDVLKAVVQSDVFRTRHGE